MTRRPQRVLLVAANPVQYSSPIFRLLAQDPRLEIQVAYCSMQGAEAHLDPGFGIEVKWDVPLLEGYPWVSVPNRSPVPRGSSFFGMFNPGIWRLISRGKFDAVVLYTHYVCVTFWIALAAAKWNRVPVLFGSDAHELAPRDHKGWKLWIKKRVWPRLFRLADVVLAPSSGTVALMRFLGIPKDRVVLTPYCVNNEWWMEQSAKVDRSEVRRRWNVPEDAIVVLFCAKLQPWKRPQDLLHAFAQVADSDAYLVFAGEGPLRAALESEARSLEIADKVRFLGFVNQSELPETYRASDVFVLPSEHEPFGVVVNEAMLCRCAVIVSDRVGARFDLVCDGETGFVFPFGDINSLAAVLSSAMTDRGRLREMGEASQRRMVRWSPAENIAGFVQSVARATATSGRTESMSRTNGNLKILIYGEYFLPIVGGVQSAMNLLARGLVGLNSRKEKNDDIGQIEVTVATMTAANGMDDSVSLYRVVRRPGFLRLVKLIREADVIHVAGPCLLPMAISWLIGKPFVVEHHGYQAICPNGLLFLQPAKVLCPGHFMLQQYGKCLRCCSVTMGPLGSFRSFLLTFPRRWLAKKAAANITITDHVATRVKLPRSRTVYYGIEEAGTVAAAEILSRPRTLEIAYVGRLVFEKGPAVLLHAAKALNNKGTAFKLVFVGDGPERNSLEELTDSLGLRRFVKFTGDLRGSHLVRAVSNIDVVVMPSIMEETAGLSAIEQMMRGKVVIAADIGGLSEVVAGAGLKFAPSNALALASCIQQLIDNPALMTSLGSVARNRAMQVFNLESMIRNHVAVYQEVS